MAPDTIPLAAVLLAQDAAARDALPAMSAAARDAGAQPVVVVLARGAEAPPDTRVARVNDGAPAISAVRAGMALLTNTVARLALVWPATGADAMVDLAALRALAAAARDSGAAVTAFAGQDLDRSPVIVARDAWLDLLTLGEQGIGAVAARRGVTYVALGED